MSDYRYFILVFLCTAIVLLMTAIVRSRRVRPHSLVSFWCFMHVRSGFPGLALGAPAFVSVFPDRLVVGLFFHSVLKWKDISRVEIRDGWFAHVLDFRWNASSCSFAFWHDVTAVKRMIARCRIH